jgi:AAHS family 4-hydroxybenzoate transporter-like MFS transporter
MNAADALESARIKALRIRTVILCFLVVLIDGFDTVAIGFAAPQIARDWGLNAAAMTPAFVATGTGALLGYLLAGPLTARLGHRAVILGSVCWFGVSSMLTLFADTISTLAALRFLTALGLGGAMPASIALASEYSVRRYREIAATVVGTGFALGVVIGGITAKPLLAAYGWTAIFLVGGTIPLLLLPFVFGMLPQSLNFALTRQAASAATQRLIARIGIDPASVTDMPRTSPPATRAVLEGGLARHTLLLWAFAFLIFMDTYLFTFWTPLLLTELDFSTAEAASGTAAFGVGSVVGALVAMPAIGRFGVVRVLVAMSLFGAAAVAALSLLPLSKAGILLTLSCVGAGLAFGNIGQAAAGVAIYPVALRPLGIGLSSAWGRLGGIVGPAIAGGLLYLQWPVRDVMLIACVPAVAAAIAMAALAVSRSRRALAAAD